MAEGKHLDFLETPVSAQGSVGSRVPVCNFCATFHTHDGHQGEGLNSCVIINNFVNVFIITMYCPYEALYTSTESSVYTREFKYTYRNLISHSSQMDYARLDF